MSLARYTWLQIGHRQRACSSQISKRHFLAAAPVVWLNSWWFSAGVASSQASDNKLDANFVTAFNKVPCEDTQQTPGMFLCEALSESGNPEKADRAWTDVIELDASNSYAWSNRGTVRLQQVRTKLHILNKACIPWSGTMARSQG